MDIYNIDKLKNFILEPQSKDKFNIWIQQNNVVQFLEQESEDEYIIIYASFLPNAFIHSTFITEIELNDDEKKELSNWSSNPFFSSWGIECSSDEVWISPPSDDSNGKILKTGEPILFGRQFQGDPDNEYYFELNQKLAHVLNIHYDSDRKAWCGLDKYGDIDEVVKIIKIDSLPKNQPANIVCIKKSSLYQYTGIENLFLVRMFEFTRYNYNQYSAWGEELEKSELTNFQSIFGSLQLKPHSFSHSKGVQVLDIRLPKKQILDSLWSRSNLEEKKQYCTYIAHNLKNQKIEEISCNPSCLANYFTKSKLPFGMTPAFFKPEVLLKYKADRDKYQLDSKSVSCRGAWHLETFDINTAGQVHTYLIYLGGLPYEEQLHWKQYNIEPKTLISDRAVKRDFCGEWDEEYDPLLSLKQKLDSLEMKEVKWWTLRDIKALNKVHYPYTTSNDEWADEILHLDQLLVEGLEEKWLRKKAKELDCNCQDNLRALKLLEAILIAIKFDKSHAREIMSPFHTVHNLRSTVKGHANGKDARKEKKAAINKHGSFKKHFEKLCTDCDESIEIIINTLKNI